MTIFVATFKIFGCGLSVLVFRWAEPMPRFFDAVDRGVRFGAGRIDVSVLF